MNVISWCNFALSLTLIGYTVYAMVHGRKVLRGMMFWNGIAGVWLFLTYLVVIYDAFFKDILLPREVTYWLIRPLVFVLGFIILTNSIVIGRRHGDQ